MWVDPVAQMRLLTDTLIISMGALNMILPLSSFSIKKGTINYEKLRSLFINSLVTSIGLFLILVGKEAYVKNYGAPDFTYYQFISLVMILGGFVISATNIAIAFLKAIY